MPGTELGFNTQLGTWYPAETQTTVYVNDIYIYRIQDTVKLLCIYLKTYFSEQLT